ncbi:MAG: Gfo/Idh/MocA family oxidoreductase [Candidatus Poribacteria bacterium]
MHRCAIVGCGPRARDHAAAYAHITRGELVAICDIDGPRLAAFGDEFGVDARYTDLDAMLEAEAPDVLHIGTAPAHRFDLIAAAVSHGVGGVIVEKPIAMQGEDYDRIRLLDLGGTRVCVNHQLQFHTRVAEMQAAVLGGVIGDVRLIEVSSTLGLSGQGTHILQLASAFAGGVTPTSVFGQVSGAGWLDGSHPCPEASVAVVNLADGTQIHVRCGSNGPVVRESDPIHLNKRLVVYGTRGLAEWTMSSWELHIGDAKTGGVHEYYAADLPGQIGLTEAMFDWLEDASRVHPTNLQDSLTQFNVILGLYMSALERRGIDLPVEPDADLLGKLRKRLARA